MSIDVELSSIDINQCDAQTFEPTDGGGKNGKSDRTGSTDSVKLLEFLGTHKCKPSTQVMTKQNTKRKLLAWLFESWSLLSSCSLITIIRSYIVSLRLPR